MSKTLKTKTMTVQRDEEGPFIRWNGRTFRPDPYLRKDTSQNLEVRSDLARMGMPVGPILDHVTPRAGDRVTVSIDPSTRTDNIGVFTDIDRDGLRTREVWPEGVAEGQGNFLTWSDETAPLRPELDDDGDGPVPPPAPRR